MSLPITGLAGQSAGVLMFVQLRQAGNAGLRRDGVGLGFGSRALLDPLSERIPPGHLEGIVSPCAGDLLFGIFQASPSSFGKDIFSCKMREPNSDWLVPKSHCYQLPCRLLLAFGIEKSWGCLVRNG